MRKMTQPPLALLLASVWIVAGQAPAASAGQSWLPTRAFSQVQSRLPTPPASAGQSEVPTPPPEPEAPEGR